MPRPSRPWFRWYVEAAHDRKLRRLKPEYRWLFVACCSASRESCEPGWLLVAEDTPMRLDDLADYAAMSRRAVSDGTYALMEVGVLGFSPQREAWFVPAWDGRQYESDDVTQRTRKHRSKERSNDVPGNAPDTETDTEPPSVPPEVWTEFARQKAENLNVGNFDAWSVPVIAQAKARYGMQAALICARYVASPTQIAYALLTNNCRGLEPYKRKVPA